MNDQGHVLKCCCCVRRYTTRHYPHWASAAGSFVRGPERAIFRALNVSILIHLNHPFPIAHSITIYDVGGGPTEDVSIFPMKRGKTTTAKLASTIKGKATYRPTSKASVSLRPPGTIPPKVAACTSSLEASQLFIFSSNEDDEEGDDFDGCVVSSSSAASYSLVVVELPRDLVFRFRGFGEKACAVTSDTTRNSRKPRGCCVVVVDMPIIPDYVSVVFNEKQSPIDYPCASALFLLLESTKNGRLSLIHFSLALSELC